MKNRVLRAIRLSALAYDEPIQVGEYLEQVGMSHYTPILNTDTDVQGFMCMDEDTLWVSIRGTEFDNVKDWLTNLDCRKVELGNGGYAHRGFYTDALSVASRILPIAEKALDSGKKVCFTGHSQGGAVTLQLFVHLMPQFYDDSFAECIPIEAPRSFSKEAAGYVGYRYGERITPVRHNNDIVTRMPPKAMGFRHVPGTNLQYINRKGKVFHGIGFWRKLWDSILGYLDDLGTPGLDCLKDHDVNRIAKIWRKSMR